MDKRKNQYHNINIYPTIIPNKNTFTIVMYVNTDEHMNTSCKRYEQLVDNKTQMVTFNK